MEWIEATDIKNDLKDIIAHIDLLYIDLDRIYYYRTTGSKIKAYARTWAFPKIFQKALNIQPAYVIEVLAKYYDKLDEDKKKKVLIHELLHIPKNFSGALLPHKTKSRNLHFLANQLFKEYKKKTKI
ncbi:MAG TPA: putative metallopeptidase [Candidatus Sulfotelmatobacter sp.]|jgi:predicted metallopeptidase|nr:putative metallopeptidase [Candidatus Sulfotelmatobacter sp.]